MSEQRIEINGYGIDGEGRIYRGDEQVGTRNLGTGEVTYLEGMAKYRQRVGRFLNELAAQKSTSAADEATNAEVAEPEPEEAVIESPEVEFSEIEQKAEPVDSEGQGEELEPEVEAKAAESVGEPVAKLTHAEILRDWPEGAPPTDWRGDLMPEFVDWYYKEYPERAALRYAGRRTYRDNI